MLTSKKTRINVRQPVATHKIRHTLFPSHTRECVTAVCQVFLALIFFLGGAAPYRALGCTGRQAQYVGSIPQLTACGIPGAPRSAQASWHW